MERKPMNLLPFLVVEYTVVNLLVLKAIAYTVLDLTELARRGVVVRTHF